MKKNIFRIAIVAMVTFAMPTIANAQISDILNKAKDAVAGSSSTGKTVTNVLGNILGKGKVSEASLKGTWVYTEPCVAFESENVLSNVGGSIASEKVEEKLKKALEKAGIKAGKMTLTFNDDKSFAMTVGKKSLAGTYELSGSDLTLTFNSPKKSIKTNVKITLGTLQIAMNADKMLEIVNTIATKASAYSSQMATISTLLSQYKGMYLGMKFNKQ